MGSPWVRAACLAELLRALKPLRRPHGCLVWEPLRGASLSSAFVLTAVQQEPEPEVREFGGLDLDLGGVMYPCHTL